MTSATASWAAATDNKAVVGYDYKVNAGTWQSLSNVLSVNLTSLSAATSYTVQIRARDAASNLGPASSNAFTTPDTQAPSVPTGLSGSAPNSSTVNLSWNASTDNVAVAGYRVYRGGSQIGTSATTSYSDGGRTGSTTYSYQVAAYDAATNVSGLSGAINVTTPDTIAPSAQTSPSAAALSSSQINQYVSGDTQTSVVNAVSSSTRWSRSMTGNGSVTSVWRCRVSDTLGATVYTGNVTVTFTQETNQ